MSTLEEILQCMYRLDLTTQTCIGLAYRLNAGYKSKECKEAYLNAEKWRAKDWEELCSYPQHWVDTARFIQYLRSNAQLV